jgi:ElaB/YqjD/DUF883 family membrane-anchored ribosome-binding protein
MADKSIETEVSAISASLALLREDIARLSDTLSEHVREQANAARATLKGAVGDAKDQVSQGVSSAQESALAAASDFERRVEKSPLTAVLIATAVGLALGMMTRSRG